MKREDIIRKLTSRKFWLAVAAFVTELIVVFRGGAELAESVTAIIMAGATVIAYIVGEGLIDAEAKGEDLPTLCLQYSCPEDDIVPRDDILSPGSTREKESGFVAWETENRGQREKKPAAGGKGSYAYFIPVVDGVQGLKGGD